MKINGASVDFKLLEFIAHFNFKYTKGDVTNSVVN